MTELLIINEEKAQDTPKETNKSRAQVVIPSKYLQYAVGTTQREVKEFERKRKVQVEVIDERLIDGIQVPEGQVMIRLHGTSQEEVNKVAALIDIQDLDIPIDNDKEAYMRGTNDTNLERI